MRNAVKTIVAILVLGGLAFSGTQFDLKVGNRTSIIYAPDNRNNPALVISMHGIGIPAGWNQGMMLYEPIADTANFIVAYPSGEGGSWDLGSNKDVNFILAIIDSMYNRYKIDRNRVYASGFSMGGMMSWYLSCKIPDKIAAIVPGNGYPMGGISGCSEVRHVPALQIHGKADDFVSYSGFVNNFLPAQRTRYGCPATPSKITPYPVGVNGRNAAQLAQPSKSYLETWAPCVKDGLTSEISLLTVDGMIHDWATPNKLNASDDLAYKGKPFDVNGTWEAWNWMRTRSLTGSTPVVTIPAHRDTIFNGGFGQGTLGWTLNAWGGTGQGSVANGEYKAQITTLGTANSSIQLVQNGLILKQGKSYEVKFDAYAAANRTLEVNVELDVSPWTSYLTALKNFDLNTTKSPYSFVFTMTNPTDSNGRLSFNLGASTVAVTLDNISIREVDTPIAIRAIAGRIGSAMVAQKGARLEVNFGSTQGTLFKLGVFDLAGKQVRSGTLRNEGQENLSWSTEVADLPKGVYVVKVNIDGNAVHGSRILIGQ